MLNFNKPSWYLRILLGVSLCFLNIPIVKGQESKPDYKKQWERLLTAFPSSYQEIDTIFQNAKQDSLQVRKLLQEARKTNYLVGQAYALNTLGIQYKNLDKYHRAIEALNEAFELGKKAENTDQIVLSLNLLGVTYLEQEAIKTALDYSQEALSMVLLVQEPSTFLKQQKSVALHTIATIYQLLGQPDLAIERYKQSAAVEKELSNKAALAKNLLKIGECSLKKQNLEEALQYFRKSLVYYEIIDDKEGELVCHYSIAACYIQLEKASTAVPLLKDCLEKATSLEDPKILAAVHTHLGWGLLKTEKNTLAQVEIEKGLQLALSNNDYPTIEKAHKLLSDLFTSQKKYKEAFEHYKEYSAYENRLSRSFNVAYITDLVQKQESETKESKLKILAEENELVRLKLRNNKTLSLIIALFISLLAGVLYILYKQNRLNGEKKLLTLEQSMLRSQMNPHFLFNSLNSIKLYIINNDKKNAVHYLNKFSKLVRKILEVTVQKEITLAEELETAALYMNIENIRFSNEIDFKVVVNDNLDPHHIKIPSLILQPFLENSLWHGLSSKQGEKNITITVSKKNNHFIEISIVDNGIGRDNAKKIKDSKILKKKSLGIDITKERLSNFSRDYVYEFDFEIIDTFDNHKNPTGTKVIIHIPTM